ncbi:MAG: hypothetical protein MI919_27720, partial [Holophagales bacterium]|nr:hypothetical protein [Holophagales bacterium]
LSLELVDYPHVRPAARPVPARLGIDVAEIELPAIGRVGYVRGASDRLPELLADIGLRIELLDPRILLEGDLADFDAIVIGSRAYEVEPSLSRASRQLHAYARRGGTVIVQYQQYAFASGENTPFPLGISRPHDRVTDETAPVRLLDPDHPVFHRPNRIGDGDWRGWVQERGLYFGGSWSEDWQPLLGMADPVADGPWTGGERGEERLGSLLVAYPGDGVYVYTGLAFFRQLPAGVTGAYRLFTNLLALEGRRTQAGEPGARP